MTPIYLDNNATTRVDPRVLEAMLPFFTEDFGNAASRSHVFGWKAEAAVSAARETVAAALGANANEIVFTSGATESINLALFGAARARRSRGMHLVTAATEHKAGLDTCRALESEGFRVTVLPPDSEGRVSVASVEAALQPDTTLVSVMAANNEVGALNPMSDIAGLTKARGILFHTDAAQAFGKIPLDVHAWGIDLVSISGHKLYGPKGVGALFVRAQNPRVRLLPLQHGGGHERGMRSGTLDVPGIVGLGAATRIALAERGAETARLAALRSRLLEGLRAGVPDLFVNGPLEDRLPGNLNVGFPGTPADDVMALMRDVAVSTGSACSSNEPEPSHVLLAMGRSAEEAKSSLRFGLGRFTTLEEIERATASVIRAVDSVRTVRKEVGLGP